MIHGGAGDFSELGASEREAYRQAIAAILDEVARTLEAGAGAVDAVEHSVCLLEDDPLFNAGRGSVLNEFGMVEMDAGIMDGRDLSAGAVAAVRQVKHPVSLARRIMQQDRHVLLVAEGAERFARNEGIELKPQAYFVTQRRLEQLQRARRHGRVSLDHDPASSAQVYSTVGAVARDVHGNLAAATSTGGMTNKRWGRVGDSPLPGAGVYADNRQCAVSATGVGEHIMRFVLAKQVASQLDGDANENSRVIRAVLDDFRTRLEGQAGLIVVDTLGTPHGQYTTQGMIHGWTGLGQPIQCRID